MPFFGRKRELSQFQAFFSQDEANLAIVFGRRRVGKSELIKQSIQESGLRHLYLECSQTSEAQHVELLVELGARLFNLPGIAADRFDKALEFLAQQSVKEPLIVVLDEYPYLRDLVTGCDSILQAFSDRWRGQSKLKLVLCGSYIDVMKSVLEYKSPLYGRAALTLQLEPLNYREAALFYPEASDEDKVRFFSIFGGMPYYNTLINSGLSVRENILSLLSSEAAVLDNEITMVLRSELSKLNNANLVLTAIANGARKFSDILSQSKIAKSPTLADSLERLTAMGLVAKDAPINDEANRRRIYYRIADPLTDFYYRYIFRNSSQLHVLPEEDFYDIFVGNDFETQFVPKAFEGICRQYLILRNKAGLHRPPFFKIGRYFYDLPKEKRNGEFDVVTEDQEGYVFYEAKFRSQPLTMQKIRLEMEQVRASPLAADRFGFFSRSGFAEDVEPQDNVALYSLSDVYGTL